MNSEQRTLESYQMIYVWKVIRDPWGGAHFWNVRKGGAPMRGVRTVKGKYFVQNLRRKSFQVCSLDKAVELHECAKLKLKKEIGAKIM